MENNLSNNSNASSSHNILKSKNLINNIEYNESKKKIVNFNIIKEKEKEMHNSIVKEEKLNEDKENKSKTTNTDAKKMKKIKIFNFSENKNVKNKSRTNMNSKENYSKTINVGITKNKNKNKGNMNKITSFYRIPNSRETSLRTKINYGNNKGELNLQKSIMSLTINEGKRYKTLDEVFHEIRVQENKFNSDSYGGYVASLLNGLKKINEERKDIKKLLGESDKKDISLNFHKNYLSKLAKKKKSYSC